MSGHPKEIPSGIARKLHRLRSGVRRWFLVDGLGKVLFVILGIAGVDLVLDWYFRMDKAQRGVMLGLMILVAGIFVWRKLIRPLTARVTDDALLHEVEKLNDEESREAVISAVEFARMDRDALGTNVSRTMVEQTIDRGAEVAGKLKFGKVLRGGRFAGNLLLLILAASGVVAAGIATQTTKSGNIWFNRNIMLGDAKWPQDFFLEVAGAPDGVIRVPFGDDWPIRVEVAEESRKLPEAVDLELETAVGTRREAMNKLDGGKAFQYYLRGVTEPFEIRAVRERINSPWVKIELVSRPEVTALELVARAPQYAGGEEEPLPPGRGPYYVLKGSTLNIKGTASKKLARATLMIGDRPVELKLTADNLFELDLAAEALLPGSYAVEVEDTEQIWFPELGKSASLKSKKPTRFEIRYQQDRFPDVKASLEGIGSMVVPKAVLPYRVRLEDDYGLTSALIKYSWRKDEGGAEVQEGEVKPEGLEEELAKSKRLRIQDGLELPPLEIPTGSSFSLWAVAADNDDVSGPKEAESNKILLRVVTEAELREDMLRREKEQRQAFEELVKKQDDLLTETQALEAASRNSAELAADQKSDLVRMQKRQKLLTTNLEPMLDRFSGIVLEIRNNRLEEEAGPMQSRLGSKIIEPLQFLAETAVPLAATRLDEARRVAPDKGARQSALSGAISQQQVVLNAMREVLAAMVKNEGFQEAVNLLYDIRKSQQSIKELTEEEKKTRIRDLLNEGGEAEGSTDPGKSTESTDPQNPNSSKQPENNDENQ